MQLDFSKINAYEGGQDSSFEELVCQLAHLQKPDQAKTFVRKEGAGGDAGVECYWQLEDGTEHGWQAKYFIGKMTSQRWAQLDKSFSDALEKHPNLTRYVVCLPFDRTDIRRKKTGKKKKGESELVSSIQDEWNTHVKKWHDLALSKGRSIAIDWWGGHEIKLFLTIDDPRYSGRALYWFGEPILRIKTLAQIAEQSREILGDRYTPEFNVELPIAKKLNGLFLNSSWWDSVRETVAVFSERHEEFFKHFAFKDVHSIERGKCEELKERSYSLLSQIENSIQKKNLVSQIDEFKETIELLETYDRIFRDGLVENFYTDNKHFDARNSFHDYFAQLRDFSRFLNSEMTEGARSGAVLIYGKGGIGKSHLLCDLTLQRLEQSAPTLFILGQHYNGGDPVALIKSSLEYNNLNNSQVLGAIDAAGEAKKCKALIVIDAINEGEHYSDWGNHIEKFVNTVSAFPNIALLISCRTTYLNYLLPTTLTEQRLTRIQHHGFLGYEHRAAEIYLSKNGIVKPSAPILAPEFTNPLFLKSCCVALKAQNLSAFPKGLNGLTKIFDFYLHSVEQKVARRKRYDPADEKTKSALVDFASRLFPDFLGGIPEKDARKFLNEFDPNPAIGESFFNELLHEGVISKDIAYNTEGKGTPVVRFTYERFSEYFTAQQILSQYQADNITSLFSPDSLLGKAIAKNEHYKYSGLFEALTIAIPEKFGQEILDLLPQDTPIREWEFYNWFIHTLSWRSPDSFSERTLQLLNGIPQYHDAHTRWNSLLELATEPEHPWNAEFIHRNLLKMAIPDRDSFWSVHVAHGDATEEEDGHQSTLRGLIEWSCFGEVKNAEKERIRLCAVTLLWFLTTPNRIVRDHSTKSLVRMLTLHAELLPDLIKKFSSVNDPYLTERLYAVAYGVVCNVDEKNIITAVAEVVSKHVFKNKKIAPHILLRDYARGILELALTQGCLPANLGTKAFRPPYKSAWPIENPTQEQIDKLTGDEYKSLIRSSLMGFPGDFGNYTMSCVHEWSPTPLTLKKPETGYDLQKKFAEQYLNGSLKKKYLKKITPEPKTSFDPIKFFADIDNSRDANWQKKLEKQREEDKKLKEEIEAILNPVQQEYFRWLQGLSSDRPAAFSRKWAQRWVCKKAYEIGWTEELFGAFEKSCSHGRGSGNGYMERMGKKYQWIGLHELLGRMSDNLHWIDRGYTDIEDKEYYGPWQMHKRNIDPTIWLREIAKEKSIYHRENTWWQPYSFPISEMKTHEDRVNFMWAEDNLPDFKKMLKVKNPANNSEWTVLRGFWMQRELEKRKEKIPTLDCWFRINSIIVKKGSYELLLKNAKDQTLVDPHIINLPSTGHQAFLGEYPWHPSCRDMSGRRKAEDGFKSVIPVDYLVPVAEYEWESGSYDYSVNESLSLYLPAREVIEEMKLKRSRKDFGTWEDANGAPIFTDPSVSENGISYALIKSEILETWLDKNDLELIWLIGGEKQLFAMYGNNFVGRLVYSAAYKLDKAGIIGDMWFEKQNPG